MVLASPLKTVIGRNGSIIRKKVGGGGRIEKVRSNGADLFIGAAVTRVGETEDDPDVDLAAKGEPIDGIIIGADSTSDYAGDLDKDSDDPYPDNEWLLMYVPLPGEEIYLCAKTNTAFTVYTRAQVDGGFIIPFAYTNATEELDLLESVIGTVQNAVSAVASTETVVALKWGGF